MKLFSKAMTGAALLATFAASAQAQTVDVQGNTSGCFIILINCSAVDNPKFTPLLSNGSIAFDGLGSFDWPAVAGVPQTVDLGTLTVTGNGSLGLLGYDANFKLVTTITAPPTSPSTGNYYAEVDGNFLSKGSDKLDVNFGNTPINYVFDGGTLSLLVNDMTYSKDGTQNVTGTLTYTAADVSSTPEPSSMALLGTGLIGLVPMARRRMKK